MPQFSSSRFEQQIELLKKCTGKRWTIREIAKETGISPAYLIFLKNGHRRNPSHEILVKLSHLFGIAPENLLETETDVQTQPQTPQIETGEFTSQTLQFCKQLLLSNNPEQVLQLLSLLESSVTESDSFEAYVEKQLIKASAYVQLGAYDQSEAILSEMQTLPLHDTFVAKLLLVRGYMNTRRGNAAQAITDFQTALQHTEHSKPVELVCLLHMELSQRYKEFDEYGLVIYHVEQTIRHLPEQADDKKHAH
ncbi:MAG: helix-turn-helix domain-containing protein, partial [Tumebacillaceae bacterium]